MMIRGSGALVTGGSEGLGAALAKELAKRGARVVVVARGEAKLHEVVRAIRRDGGDAHAVVGDVGDKLATHAIAGAAAALIGSVDLLIHNASTLGPVPLPLLLDTRCEALQQVLEVNVVGPFRLSKVIVGGMVLRDRGLVVHVSSDAAVEAYPGWGAYGASKAAHDHLVRVWAAELSATKVRFLSVDPGEMDTRMHKDAMPDADTSQLARPVDVARRLVDLIARSDAMPSGSRSSLSVEVAP